MDESVIRNLGEMSETFALAVRNLFCEKSCWRLGNAEEGKHQAKGYSATKGNGTP